MAIDEHPLVTSVTQALEAEWDTLSQGVSEYSLIKILSEAPYHLFDPDALREPLTLFQTHFVLFHCLYRLQLKWAEQHSGDLTVSALNIQLRDFPSSRSSRQHGALACASTDDSLQRYYLDWQHFGTTQSQDVEQMLDSFWQNMHTYTNVKVGPQDIEQACALLQLAEEDWRNSATVKRQYRKLQHQYHPDKGGDLRSAQRLTWAYQTLMKATGNP